MKFPYGISDFRQVIGEGYYFVDRSDHIRILEEIGKQLLFLRPRRFGKSLLLSMLENYYDVARAGEFDNSSATWPSARPHSPAQPVPGDALGLLGGGSSGFA